MKAKEKFSRETGIIRSSPSSIVFIIYVFPFAIKMKKRNSPASASKT